MNPLAFLSPTRWLLALGMAIALWIGYQAWANHQQGIGEARAVAKANAATAKQKADAAATLERERTRTSVAEKALIDFKNAQEIEDAKNQRTVAALESRLRALAGPAGRLRDPNAIAGCGPSGGSTQGASATTTDRGGGDATQASGLLSTELTGLLQRLTAEADEVNLAYIACHADALSARSH